MRATCAGRFAVDSIRAIAKKLRAAIFASLELLILGHLFVLGAAFTEAETPETLVPCVMLIVSTLI